MNRNTWKENLLHILLVVETGLCALAATYLYTGNAQEMVRNTIVMLTAAISISFGWNYGKTIHVLLYNNEMHFKRFWFFYVVAILFSCFLPLFPYSVWPILAFALAFAFFSNPFLGVFSYTTVLMMPILIADAPVSIFLFYFVSGMVAIMLFQYVDEGFRVVIPIVVTLLFFFLSETSVIVLFINEQLSWTLFVLPCLNLFLNTLLLMSVLKYFSFAIVHQFKSRFLEINDPEFVLMSDLKARSRDDYFLAIHTAYFSERIANAIGADVDLTKACAYYHRFGKIERMLGNTTVKEADILADICKKNDFPPGVIDVLTDCVSRRYESKESTIVMYSDAVVTSILYLLRKDPEAKPDYLQVIDLIFKKKEESGCLRNSKISIHDLIEMKQVFIKEKLYYDFLS